MCQGTFLGITRGNRTERGSRLRIAEKISPFSRFATMPTIRQPHSCAQNNRPPPLSIEGSHPTFFVVSSFRNGLIWYDRCNFVGQFITCVLINYPANEKSRWRAVITRISNSLSRS
jgi:hypothetical protein